MVQSLNNNTKLFLVLSIDPMTDMPLLLVNILFMIGTCLH